MSNMLDLLILHGIVLTMAGEGVGLIPDGAVGIRGNRIIFVGSSAEAENRYAAHRYIDADNKAVMPGLIDAHIHTGIGLLRGVAQDINNWMQNGMWPFESALRQDVDAILSGSLMNIIEAVKSGTTTFGDFDCPMGEIVKNHQKLGTRACVAELISELPANGKSAIGELYEFDPAEGQRKFAMNMSLIQDWHEQGDGRITCLLGPQGADMVSMELLGDIQNIARKQNIGIHMHVSQGDREINQMIKRYGKRTIPFLDEIGYLNSHLLAVHLTEASREETRHLAEKGAGMVLCSGSIGIIDGIIPPAAEFLQVSSRLALGSDQAPGNNCSNMFNEMKFTSILNKCKAKDPTVFPAWKVLRMATVEAARAIGLGNEIGSLEKGKKGDVLIVNLNQPGLAPVILDPIRNIVPNLVYAAKGSEVETVIIDGKIIVDEYQLMTANEKEAVAKANAAAQRVCQAAAPAFYKIPDNPLYRMMKDEKL